MLCSCLRDHSCSTCANVLGDIARDTRGAPLDIGLPETKDYFGGHIFAITFTTSGYKSSKSGFGARPARRSEFS